MYPAYPGLAGAAAPVPHEVRHGVGLDLVDEHVPELGTQIPQLRSKIINVQLKIQQKKNYPIIRFSYFIISIC